MPRVVTKKYEYAVNDLYAYLIGQMKVRGVTQEALGEELGVTQQVISSKLRKRQLSTKELIEVLDILEVEGRMVAQLMGRKT